MRNFKRTFENLGYTFQSNDVLEDVYTFYKYYNNPTNEGVASLLLEGDPGSGKSYLSEVFSKFFLDDNTCYLYTQCVDETNSDKLISTLNVPAIMKGDSDRAIAEGILTKAINLVNSGKRVVLTIDELDKARESLDSYFLNFLQKGKIETSDNNILSIKNEYLKNLYVILAKNDQRSLLDALLRRCAVVFLPPMPPVLAYKTLLRKFELANHDAKFLKFTSKVYEAIYNEQVKSNNTLLRRLPALQELATAIAGDYELYDNGVSSTRRISSLIRKLGKDEQTREIITDILIKKFKYENQESNYNTEVLDLEMTNPDDYMNTKDADSLIEQYIKKKETGEYVFEEEEPEDAMSEIASILDNMKDDRTLVFLNKEDKEKIVELGIITNNNPNALQILFDKIRFKGNPNSKFAFLNFEGDNFIGLTKYRNSLILITNKEYISPRLFIKGLSTIIAIIYELNENASLGRYCFSPYEGREFKLTSLNAKILSKVPNMVVNKMTLNNGEFEYQTSNLKITYNEDLNVDYFKYLQKYSAEPIYDVIKKMCMFNPELAIPASFITAERFSMQNSKKIVQLINDFNYCKDSKWKRDYKDWTIEVAEFPVMRLSFPSYFGNFYTEDDYVFESVKEENYDDKIVKIFPKYYIKDNYLFYTRDIDFENDEVFTNLSSEQKEVALLARSIYGNFVPMPFNESYKDYFSANTMFYTGKILEDKNNRLRIPEAHNDITEAPEFVNYYDSISSPTIVVTAEKVYTKRFNNE